MKKQKKKIKKRHKTLPSSVSSSRLTFLLYTVLPLTHTLSPGNTHIVYVYLLTL